MIDWRQGGSSSYSSFGSREGFLRPPIGSLALDPTFGIHSHKTLDTAQPSHLLKPNWKPSSSHSISILTNISTQFLLQSVCVCVCVWVCVCVCVCVIISRRWDKTDKVAMAELRQDLIENNGSRMSSLPSICQQQNVLTHSRLVVGTSSGLGLRSQRCRCWHLKAHPITLSSSPARGMTFGELIALSFDDLFTLPADHIFTLSGVTWSYFATDKLSCCVSSSSRLEESWKKLVFIHAVLFSITMFVRCIFESC